MTTDQNIFKSPEAFHEALAKANKEAFPTTLDDKPQDVSAIEAPILLNESLTETSIESHTEQMEVPVEQESQEPEQVTEKQEKTHLIPKSRFNEELNKRKVAEEQLQKEREERIKIESQWEMLAKMQQQQPKAPAEPEFDPLDIDTYNFANRKIQELEKKLENVVKETAERTQQMQYMNVATAQEQAFTREHPDFHDAMNHVRDIEMNITKSFISDATQAKAYVDQKLQGILIGSINNGKNAAEIIYNMAKTYGYQNGNKVHPGTNKPTTNIPNINKNMERTATIQNLNNSGSMGAIPNDIQAALDEKGRFVQSKWDALLAKQKKAAGY